MGVHHYLWYCISLMLFRRTHIFAHRSSVLDIDFMTPLLAVGALVGIYTTFASAVVRWLAKPGILEACTYTAMWLTTILTFCRASSHLCEWGRACFGSSSSSSPSGRPPVLL